MEAAGATEGLDRESLRTAELGFRQLLRRKRISEDFLAKHAEDLFGQAQREYASWIAAGNVAANPVGWLINCAWRRTQDLLDALARRPRAVSVDDAVYLADTSTPSPEEQAIDGYVHERLQAAIGCLPERDQRLLELVYFEGFDVFAAGRELGWGKSTSHRHHEAALKRLRAVLPDDLDALDVEIGLAAWVAIAGGRGRGWSLPGGLEAMLDGARDGAAGVAHRLGELWRKASPAAEPGTASAAGGAARAAGVCGAAAAACLASGMIGPGVGDVADLVTHERPKAARKAPAPAARETPAPAPASTVTPRASTASGEASSTSPQRSKVNAKASSTSRSSPTSRSSTSRPSGASVPQTSAQQTEEEFGIESGAGTPTTSPGSSTSSSGGSGSSGSSGSSPPSRSSSSVADEFGL